MSRAEGTVVLVDEQPLVSKALASRLQAQGFTILASLRTATETLAFLRETAVDVVLLGLPLRGDGLACLREIRTISATVRVVVCNAPGDGNPDAAFAEGAAAYVEKSGDPDDIVAAVRQATSRSIFLAPSAAHGTDTRTAVTPLTPREVEVVALVAEGSTNAAIARQLGVSEQAVKFHLSNIFRKLGVSNRTEMSLHAQLRGLLPTKPGLRDSSQAS